MVYYLRGRKIALNYVMYYFFDNYDIVYECKPCVRHGATISMYGCIVRFYLLRDPQILFWMDGNVYTREQAEEIFEKVSKALSYVFDLPIFDKECYVQEVDWCIEENSILSQKSAERINWIEIKTNKFNTIKEFYNETLDLLIVAIDNFYKCRYEDAYVYFFKVVERIAKHYYTLYMDRHHGKSQRRKNKNDLKNLLKNYALHNLQVEVTENMLETKVDLFYKDLLMSFYGSIFNKISLFVTKENIMMNMNKIDHLVKLRNKIAHGDMVDGLVLSENVVYCQKLALQMFSKYFFRKDYESVQIKSKIKIC